MILSDEDYANLDDLLARADEQQRTGYPGPSAERQPVHTVYLPADRFHATVITEWADTASDLLEQHLSDSTLFSDVLGVHPRVASGVLARVRGKLRDEPIEDLRIDFEDGYGSRSDILEDADATRVAEALCVASASERLPFRVGLRCKGLEPSERRRGLRTLDLVQSGLAQSGGLPSGWRLTLPKVTSAAQVGAFASMCATWEAKADLDPGTLRFEIQIETPQAVIGADGTTTVGPMLTAGNGRVSGLHYGTYDFSAACGVSAGNQGLDHPIADHAKVVMQLACAQRGVEVSDGSSNVLPIGDRDSLYRAWSLHAALVRRSLDRAIYQGWDLHPGQLISRYAATFAFYQEQLAAAASRLRNYLAKSGSGAILDEPATAQGMASVLVRGLQCGALDEQEVSERTGADHTELLALFRRRVG